MGRTTFFLLEQEQKAREEAKKQENVNNNKIDWEKEIGQYHTGGGWYKLPGHEKALRKDEAIKAMKESDN